MKSFLSTSIAFVLCLFLSHRTVHAFSPLASPSHCRHLRTGSSQKLSPTALSGVRDRVRGVIRKGVRVLTREKEATPAETEEDREPPKPYRVMYNDCDYVPMSAAAALARNIKSLDRRTAYELVSYARTHGKVIVMITNQKEAERTALLLRKKGLPATVEPHDGKP